MLDPARLHPEWISRRSYMSDPRSAFFSGRRISFDLPWRASFSEGFGDHGGFDSVDDGNDREFRRPGSPPPQSYHVARSRLGRLPRAELERQLNRQEPAAMFGDDALSRYDRPSVHGARLDGAQDRAALGEQAALDDNPFLHDLGPFMPGLQRTRSAPAYPERAERLDMAQRDRLMEGRWRSRLDAARGRVGSLRRRLSGLFGGLRRRSGDDDGGEGGSGSGGGSKGKDKGRARRG